MGNYAYTTLITNTLSFSFFSMITQQIHFLCTDPYVLRMWNHSLCFSKLLATLYGNWFRDYRILSSSHNHHWSLNSTIPGLSCHHNSLYTKNKQNSIITTPLNQPKPWFHKQESINLEEKNQPNKKNTHTYGEEKEETRESGECFGKKIQKQIMKKRECHHQQSKIMVKFYIFNVWWDKV